MELNDFLTLLTAITIAVSCSLLGCFLVLRKTVMVGDAISHSVLPGIAIAYLLSSSFNSVFMLIGAAIFGVFTTLIIDDLISSVLKLTSKPNFFFLISNKSATVYDEPRPNSQQILTQQLLYC